jgi:hypothetical protein
MTKKTDYLGQEPQGRDKAELIAIIKLMLQQHPELSWVLQASRPVGGRTAHAINSHLYRQRIETAVSAAAEHHRDRTYRENVRNILGTIQAVADELAQKADYLAALSVYEVLVAEAVKYYFTLETGYLLFTPILISCIDGLDSCVAEAGENQEMRLRAFKGLIAIYRFSVGSGLDFGEDIPDLLVGNATCEEREILAGWVRDELAQLVGDARSATKEYDQLLRKLEQEDLPV